VPKIIHLGPEQIEELKKLLIPFSSLSSLLLVLCGPWMFPTIYSYICVLFFAIILSVNFSHLIRYSYSVMQVSRVIGSWRKGKRPIASFQYLHAIFVPNYNEPLGLLQETIGQFADHTHAKTHYLLVLAMESTEKGHAEKAAALVQQFGSKFRDMLVTVHPSGIPGECRGKGSNVAWAVKTASTEWVDERGMDSDRIILTISDADSGIPELYFSEVEREMQQDPSSPNAYPHQHHRYRFFSPPIFFGRNAQDVPAIVRATDLAWSVAMMQNLSNYQALHFPCSTYSLTLPLALHVGGWDVTVDAVGEDLHMFLKCFYLTNTKARATPIWVPINLANVQASTTWETIWARYTQACRHFSGSADSLFAIRHTFSREYFLGSRAVVKMAVPDAIHDAEDDFRRRHPNKDPSFWTRLLCLMQVFEAHLVPATSWLTVLAIPVCSILAPSLMLTPAFRIVQVLSLCMFAPYLVVIFQYEYLHRFLESSAVYGRGKEATRIWRHLLDYAFLPLCAIVYVALPAVSHAANGFQILFRGRANEFKYVVAEKTLKGINDVPLGIASFPASVSSGACLAHPSRSGSSSSPDHSVVPMEENDSALGDQDTDPSDIPCTCCEPCPVHFDPQSPPSSSSVKLTLPLPPNRGHTKHDSTDSGFFDLPQLPSAVPAGPSPLAQTSS
jgi:hypothetical protein